MPAGYPLSLTQDIQPVDPPNRDTKQRLQQLFVRSGFYEKRTIRKKYHAPQVSQFDKNMETDTIVTFQNSLKQIVLQ
jgi:hypothetical protein